MVRRHHGGTHVFDATESKSSHTEVTDSDEFTATYSIKTSPILLFDSDTATFKYEPLVKLKPANQLIIQDNQQVYTQQSTFYDLNGQIYQTYRGELQQVATADTATIGEVQNVAVNQQGHWLVIAGNSAPFTAYAYASPSDIDSHTTLTTMSGVYRPLPGSIESYRDKSNTATRGFIFAEYQNSGASDVRIIQYDGSGPTFNTVLTLSTSTAQHFHSLDYDPYNEGVMYATTGDLDSEIKWYKSTDFGATWSEITAAGGSQDYRTLNLSFGPDYIYWSMDQKNPCEFYRAARNDLGNIESVGTVAPGYLSYGTCRVWDPNGIIVTARDNADQGFDTAPMYFFDLETETFRKIHEHTLNYNTGNRPGVQSILKYQDELTGSIYPEFNGVDQGRTMPSFYTAEYDVTKLQ